jgi:ABC-type dipeptide/oligopeptide/nickel transport system permease subunit
LIFPAIALGLYLLGLNLLADATNDALDPHRPRR